MATAPHCCCTILDHPPSCCGRQSANPVMTASRRVCYPGNPFTAGLPIAYPPHCNTPGYTVPPQDGSQIPKSPDRIVRLCGGAFAQEGRFEAMTCPSLA